MRIITFPPTGNMKKNILFKVMIYRVFFIGEKSHSAEKGVLGSPKAFFRPKTFMKVEGYPLTEE